MLRSSGKFWTWPGSGPPRSDQGPEPVFHDRIGEHSLSERMEDTYRENSGGIGMEERACQGDPMMKTVGIEEGLRMMKGIASLIATNLNLNAEDARNGAEAIWEIVRQIEADPAWEIVRRLEAAE